MSHAFRLDDRIVRSHRVFCIGWNYRGHIKELNNPIPQEPVIFMKPVSSLAGPGEKIRRPPYGRELHHEAEAVVLLGKGGQNIAAADAASHIAGVTVGLDLTLRDVQRELKDKRLPWELSKAFEQSAPVGTFLPYTDSLDLANLPVRCKVNGVLRQDGNTRDLIFPIPTLISHLSRLWILQPGDLIYTGTPSGVGPIDSGDTVTAESDPIGSFSWEIV